MWNLKYDTNELIYETERDSQAQRTELWLPGVGERDGLEVWCQQMQASIYRLDKQQVLPVYHREYIQYPVIEHDDEEKRKWKDIIKRKGKNEKTNNSTE